MVFYLFDLNPNFYNADYNLGNALKDQGNLNAAVQSLQKAIKLKPGYAEAHWNLSLVQLLSENYQDGWENYEWRWKRKALQPPHAMPKTQQWSGEKLNPGQQLLVVSEQGLGDTIQFMRYIRTHSF